MGEVTTPGVTEQQLLDRYRATQNAPDASLDDMFLNVMGARSVFVSPAPIKVAELLANFPASASLVGKYARVNDLWGSVTTVMICEADTSGFYWRPQRTDYAAAPVTMTTGNMPLIPLVTAPVINLTGTLTGNVTITPQTTNVWPGATFTVSSSSTIGVLLGININGLVGAGTVPLLSGGIRTITYFSGSGWKAS